MTSFVTYDRASRLGLSVCEELWTYVDPGSRSLYQHDPIAELVEAGAQVLLNISASPFALGKQETRQRIFSAQAAEHRVPLVYVNQVGGNDDLVFDGASSVYAADGTMIAQAAAFREDLLVVDLDGPTPRPVESYPAGVAAVYEALVLGTRDYVEKCEFPAVLMGVSGGIDSAVTAAIAVAALGPERVNAFALPSRYSSDHSLSDAHRLAENLGIRLQRLPIEGIHRAAEAELRELFGDEPPGVAEENIQTRIRGMLLMAISNKRGWLLLTTGNKSELATGYCTLYGDMCGGLAVISDVPKTMVYELARHINAQAGREIIPPGSISKAPSAELRENQTDQDTLPPYDLLDAVLRLYIEEEMPVEEIVARGFPRPTVDRIARMVDRAEYKRRQAAVGLKVTSRAFGTGRRLPIAARP